MAKARTGKNCWEHSTALMECVKEEHWESICCRKAPSVEHNGSWSLETLLTDTLGRHGRKAFLLRAS